MLECLSCCFGFASWFVLSILIQFTWSLSQMYLSINFFKKKYIIYFPRSILLESHIFSMTFWGFCVHKQDRKSDAQHSVIIRVSRARSTCSARAHHAFNLTFKFNNELSDIICFDINVRSLQGSGVKFINKNHARDQFSAH